MQHLVSNHPPLVLRLFRHHHPVLQGLLLTAVGVGLLSVSAKINIPFWPVPFTMQTFVVLVLGMAYGWKRGSATILAYLGAGAAGLPIFAGTPLKGIGLVYMLGPTGGYLAGFVLAVLACGYLAERGWGKTVVGTFLAMMVGNALIFAAGLTWLGMVIGWDKPLLSLGFYPFVVSGLLKTALAMAVMPLLNGRKTT